MSIDKPQKVGNKSGLVEFFSEKLIVLLFLATLGLVVFCATRLEPHYLLSKEAFLGNLYRGKIVPFIHDNEKAKKYLTNAIVNNNNEAVCDLGEVYAQEKKL